MPHLTEFGYEPLGEFWHGTGGLLSRLEALRRVEEERIEHIN